MSADQEKESLFGENQHRIYFNWDKLSDERLKMLMGDDAHYRKEFLFNNVDFSRIVE
jgi:hypothetical protein